MDIAISSDSNEKKIYQDSTHELVSKIAYLIGVPKRIFENIHEPPELFAIYPLSGRAYRETIGQSTGK